MAFGKDVVMAQEPHQNVTTPRRILCEHGFLGNVLPALSARDGVRMGPVQLLDDPVPFIRVENPGGIRAKQAL